MDFVSDDVVEQTKQVKESIFYPYIILIFILIPCNLLNYLFLFYIIYVQHYDLTNIGNKLVFF